MKVRCLGFECANMIEDTVSHGTCPHCVATEDVLMAAPKFIVSYETIDSSTECERECTTLAEAQSFIDSLDDLLVWSTISDENGEIDSDHYCIKHSAHTGEGDICGQCEAEFDNYRMLVNLEMTKHQYELWFVLSKQYSYRCPVSNFDEAKMLESSLSSGCTTGVRIARMSEEEGCEVVLHKFK